MITGIGMYSPHGYCMNFCSPLLTGGLGESKRCTPISGGAEFPKCPRCGTTMEREYQRFCDRCGQRLNWSGFDDVEVRYIGWDGVEDDEESDADGEQVDDSNQEDATKIDWKPRFPVAPVYHKENNIAIILSLNRAFFFSLAWMICFSCAEQIWCQPLVLPIFPLPLGK